MAIIKCKMCGGDLELVQGQSVAECEYCGSLQTVPNQDNEKKLLQFERAERLRRNCEFDKASGLYEAIVSEFRQEAEAYWGLVLCKYGIEYVDDPATGKKIPTCHRSSYDSVLEDSNLELALEYADVVAQKVYREEAKHFERLRKGILEVSSGEKPYDIFICYKETGLDGNRTLDSVLAQELYMALTDKGYRVFFSRITLKGKLGEAYEPYIFAALNSAKVMLAVGTCYEHYNAVWVKNEWSRYLKICAGDRSKHLIPCYKGLDPEDMPREFNHLQGADLSQMGAIQDVLINMEKYIPLAKPAAKSVVKEQVVVGGTAGNKIASALHRGNMALEDGDWAKADSFFEDVLSNDSMNAQAYLGKVLAQEKCRTVDAFIRKRLEAHRSVRGETRTLNAKEAHIQEMAERWMIPGYLEEKTIRALYDFDLSYHSDVAERKAQYKNEETYWASHKVLTKAEKFAQGDVAETLAREKKRLFDALAENVKKAEAAEKNVIGELKQHYEAHLTQADEKARELYADACDRREKAYEENLHIAKTSKEAETLEKCGKFFRSMNGFRDSESLAEHCRKRAEEIREANLREEEQRVIAQRKAEREAAEKKKKKTIIAAAACVAAVAVIILASSLIKSAKIKNTYESAMELVQAGEYAQAIALFEGLGDYEDSPRQLVETRKAQEYAAGMALTAEGNYEQAIAHFEAAGDYEDAAQQLSKVQEKLTEQKNEALYLQAEACLEQGDLAEAARIFTALGDFRDSKICSQEVRYELGLQYLMQGEHDDAYRELMNAGDYAPAQNLLSQYQRRVIRMVTILGQTESETTYEYTYDGKLSRVIEKYYETEYTYNRDGTLAETMTIDHSRTINGEFAYFLTTYDAMGSPVKIEDSFEKDVWEFSYEYAPDGSLKSLKCTYLARYAEPVTATIDFAERTGKYYVSHGDNHGTLYLNAYLTECTIERYGVFVDVAVPDLFLVGGSELDENGNVRRKNEKGSIFSANGGWSNDYVYENTLDEFGCLIQAIRTNVISGTKDYYSYFYGNVHCGDIPG